MKISDALLLQQDLSAEINRLKSLADQKSWGFHQQRAAGEEYAPNFDIDENHKMVRNLMKLKRRISRAISVANNTVEIDLDEKPYKDWM